jgi:hypothetical protein
VRTWVAGRRGRRTRQIRTLCAPSAKKHTCLYAILKSMMSTNQLREDVQKGMHASSKPGLATRPQSLSLTQGLLRLNEEFD